MRMGWVGHIGLGTQIEILRLFGLLKPKFRYKDLKWFQNGQKSTKKSRKLAKI